MRFYQFLATFAIIITKNYAKDKYSIFDDGKDQDEWTTPFKFARKWERSEKFEGDMVLTPLQRSSLNRQYTAWPNAEIPYKFAPNHFSKKQEKFITNAIEDFKKNSCVNPRPVTSKDKDYILITGKEPGCFSSVGQVGKEQILNLRRNVIGRGCLTTGAVHHEFMHSLGFYHQHTSANRDDFITIEWNNIKKDDQSHFQNYGPNFDEIYDYDSILHFGSFAFSKNGKKTIIPKNSSFDIGQTKGMSKIDLFKLNQIYNCTPTEERPLEVQDEAAPTGLWSWIKNIFTRILNFPKYVLYKLGIIKLD